MNICLDAAYKPSLPKRLVCLTEETTETLYLLGAEDLIVGISGFTVRPKEARTTKPKVSTYLEANIDQILDLKPDVVLAWSDLQADICAALMRSGVEVVGFNHRSVEGILSMILRLGALIGNLDAAEMLVIKIQKQLMAVQQRAREYPFRPRIYFEEWYNPLISGICWVSELIELCGGEDIFAENRVYPDAKRRIIADAAEVIRRKPDIIIASWCGKMFKPERLISREGWSEIPAVRHNTLFEIPSPIILQPGPAALTEGVERLCGIIDSWHQQHSYHQGNSSGLPV